MLWVQGFYKFFRYMDAETPAAGRFLELIQSTSAVYRQVYFQVQSQICS